MTDARNTGSEVSVAMTDAKLDTVNGAGVGEKNLGIAQTTGGVLTAAAGAVTRRWGLASRGCNMFVDGIGHTEAS